jgi:F0F1-type ATP synthase membrane subunit b/b'
MNFIGKFIIKYIYIMQSNLITTYQKYETNNNYSIKYSPYFIGFIGFISFISFINHIYYKVKKLEETIKKREETIKKREEENENYIETIKKLEETIKKREEENENYIETIKKREEEIASVPKPPKGDEEFAKSLQNKLNKVIYNTSKSKKNIYIENYSEKCIVVRGDDTIKYKDKLKELGGKWNPNLTDEKTDNKFGGWIFSKKKKENLCNFISCIQ